MFFSAPAWVLGRNSGLPKEVWGVRVVSNTSAWPGEIWESNHQSRPSSEQNCNLYTITKVDENDSERNEVCKVSRFYEFVHDKKSIGMPVRELKEPERKKFGSDLELVEKWPMIQAYGLDIVAGGFFSMKHSVKNIREELK